MTIHLTCVWGSSASYCGLTVACNVVHVYVCVCVSVQPAPLSETVDHTVEEEDGSEVPQTAFQDISPSPSLSSHDSPSSYSSDEDSDQEDKERSECYSSKHTHTHTQQSPSYVGWGLMCGCKFIVCCCVGEQLGDHLAMCVCVVETAHGWLGSLG